MPAPARLISIHGHFYQPPRENPWLEAVETQDSAHPWHDWNERITAECYGPNAAARILDERDSIRRIVNNYSSISFNFGATLLSWLAGKSPATYAAILEADRLSQERFSGHGSAIAQAYNHMIMPLANARDQRTQVRWGVRDFEWRFGRKPEGMWLPETAVDTASLEALAAEGIAFTILEPQQALRVRGIGETEWTSAVGGIDPTRLYRCNLPSGRSIDIFFYDGPISRAVAFEQLLARGENLAHRLAGAFSGSRSHAQLVNIATDGETYGHHHNNGDMALAYALHYIEESRIARLTNYGEYREQHPAECEVEIVEETAWSCAHGLERWRSDCGCNTGAGAGWNQRWREPLRHALDWLRDEAAAIFEHQGSNVLRDPWKARDEYIDVVLDRSDANVDAFLARHARDGFANQALELLEMQRNAMLMYTSCGWFFNDVSGIETVQVLQYAARVVQLAEKVSGQSIEPGLLQRLEPANSNLPQHGTARQIYEREVLPMRLDLARIAAHYAVASLFDTFDDEAT
ncbi:MAG: glycoside hydrolase family 57, partial [Acidobacteria bacterium]|nr:glycoside hydrolase family 57 [Acidobacteriota bacterium]